jgi:hypothetical protein
MSNQKRNTKAYWAFWLGLPTFFGGLAMAMDWV